MCSERDEDTRRSPTGDGAPFAVDGAAHRANDGACSKCCCGYPLPCKCGGLVHAQNAGEVPDGEGDYIWLHYYKCDRCGETHPVE